MCAEKATLDELRIDRTKTASGNIAWILWVVLALVVLAAALGWWITRPKTLEVRTLTVRESGEGGQRTLLNASGYVTARRESTVSSKVTGKVIEVLIEEGMNVKEGQILARIDSSNVEASVRLAEAQLKAANSALNETRVRVGEAQSELRRIQGLATSQIASASELERAQAQASSLEARLQLQEVEVNVAELQLAVWAQQLEDTVIRAPFAGVVVSKNAQPGEMISPMSAGGGFTRTGICTIVDMVSLEIEIDVNESYINRVESGQPVEATLDSYPDWKIPCKVIAIVPTADRQKATVRVRVGFEKLDRRILPQMGVKVAFQGSPETGQSRKSLRIPAAAVRRQDGRDLVMVIANGKVERRAITAGAARSEEVEVLGGLAAGERIVVAGPDALKEGDRVEEQNR